MKRIPALLIIFLLALGGCAMRLPEKEPPLPELPEALRTTPTQTKPTPAPSPALTQPVPAPEPVRVLLLADCAREEVPEYAQAISAAVKEEGWQLTECYRFQEATQKDDGAYAGVLVLFTRADTPVDAVEQIIRGGASCAVLDLCGHTLPANASGLIFASKDAAAFALSTALSYPPHDTPVRLIALLDKKDSPADKAFRAGIAEGKILSKGIFYADGKPAKAGDYMQGRLKKYVAGTVDAVYAEDVAFAQQALDELHAYKRMDMEVFAVADGFFTRQSALLERFTFPMALGADPFDAAARQVRLLRGLLGGGRPQQEEILNSVKTGPSQ